MVNNLFPSIFIGHGSPTVALENDSYSKDLKNFSSKYSKPKNIISVSAHWERDLPIQVTTADSPPQIYDFWGFPEELYQIEYSPPGSPKLAKRVVQELINNNINTEADPRRGLDHGTWIPLSIMYPEDNIPTIQVSIPRSKGPEFFIKMGEILSRFRDEDTLLMGSGNIVHNLRMVRGLSPKEKNAPVDQWAENFDSWIVDNLENERIDKLTQYRSEAPSANMAVPTTEHFYPMFFSLGTEKANEKIGYITEEFQYRNVSMRSIEITS